MTHKIALYRHYDANGVLLYVGITGNPAKRLVEHRKNSEWALNIARVTIEYFNSKEAAALAELQAIIDEKPLLNKPLRVGPQRTTSERTAMLTVRVPHRLIVALQKACEKSYKSRSALMREILERSVGKARKRS